MLNKVYISFLSLLLIVAVSCKSEPKEDDSLIADIDPSTKKAVEEAKLNAQNVFNSVPDRGKIIKLIEENKIEYNADYLNNPMSVNKYSTEFYKGINLGIYGSDLNIANIFEQTQESLTFLSCVNNLASKLGVSRAFDQTMFDRMDLNKNNKDSTLEIVTGAFKKSDEILKNDGRSTTSAVILAGCWIEGMYVGCQMANQVKAENLYKTIIDQQESLKNLVIMLEACSLSQTEQFLVVELKSIQAKIKIQTEAKTNDIKDIEKDVTQLRYKLIAGG